MNPGFNRLHDVLVNPATQRLPQSRIAVYSCPSDGVSGLNKNPTRALVQPNYSSFFPAGEAYLGTANYAAAMGLDLWGIHRTHVQKVVLNQGSNPLDGSFWTISSCRFQDITDGLSNTILIGERDNRLCQGVTWAGTPEYGAQQHASIFFNTRQKINDATGGCHHALASEHKGGVQVVFGDGRVLFLSESVQHLFANNGTMGVYQRLVAKADGLVVGEF
jgi:hypothetical protein